jgi:hypothetical protein
VLLPTVAAVYDRRRSRIFNTVGGHRPPPQWDRIPRVRLYVQSPEAADFQIRGDFEPHHFRVLYPFPAQVPTLPWFRTGGTRGPLLAMHRTIPGKDFRLGECVFMHWRSQYRRTLLYGAAVISALWFVPNTSAQTHRVTDTADATLAATVPLGSLTPGTSNTPQSAQVQFRLRSRRSTASGGYRVDAQANFVPTTLAVVAGGSTISASDIGVGITSVVPAASVDVPRADLIAPGFGYDPGTVLAVNGLTPFTGVVGGQATLADLSASRKILNGNRIGANINTGAASTNFLTVTMKFAVVPQYFTPANFSALITLTISDGP